jgi:aspartyl-tRNA(Asn)/glutamyl-tRNA(Gln) amidotransferase subunit B
MTTSPTAAAKTGGEMSVLERFEPVIGIEVHVELATESKIFCACSTSFGAAPNTHVCPVCLGMPGVLPVLNRRVIDYALRAALALGCQITPVSQFARKNYFYPDLPKGYQITQYERSLAYDGTLSIEADLGPREVRIARINIEEEAAKSFHVEEAGGDGYSLIDFNRSGVPLIEIVSAPDLRSADEARAYLTKLRNIVLYTGVSDCKMQEGSFRFDVNVSLRPRGSTEFGNLVEIKNLNSFRAAARALEHEIERQAAELTAGRRIPRETRTWDEANGRTVSMRSKEESMDYRYFPEPDLVLLRVDEDWLARTRAEMPVLPDERRTQLMREYGLSEYLAGVIVADLAMGRYFDATVKALLDRATAGGQGGKVDAAQLVQIGTMAANWSTGDVAALANEAGLDFADLPLSPAGLADLLGLVRNGTISGKMAKELLPEVWASGKTASQLVKDKGLSQVSDEGQIAAIVAQVIAANAEAVESYLAGKDRALGFLVGQVMKASRGKANPAMANQLVLAELARRQQES